MTNSSSREDSEGIAGLKRVDCEFLEDVKCGQFVVRLEDLVIYRFIDSLESKYPVSI
jgi:hypothetical protein